MSYTTREQWQSLYDDSQISELRKIAIDKLNEPGNQIHPGTNNAAKEIWDLCLAVADRVKGNHTNIYSGRSYGLNEEGYVYLRVVSVDNSKQTITIANSDNEETETDEKMFTDCLKQCEHNYGGFVNAFHHSKYGSRDILKLSKLLPMLSLGIFQKGGENWLDLCHEDVYVGRSNKENDNISEGISLTGHFGDKQEMSEIASLGEKIKNQISEIVELLELRKNVILEGVPGTGKTWLRNKVKEKMNATLETTTFHPAKTYEEFIGGIFPQNENGKLHFNYLPGTLSNVANQAMKDQSGKKYILFIDEINRANIPMVMGELLTIIESTKRVSPDGNDALTNKPTKDSIWEVAVHVEPEFTKYLRLPDNLYILASMNTSDRSVTSMDAALRRRFAYYRVETMLVKSAKNDVKVILENTKPGQTQYFWKSRNLLGKDGLFETVFEILADINQNILKKKIGPDAMLGHSYLLVTEDEVENLSDEEAISEMLQLSILPQIADILTSMNRTDSGIVNEINTMLKPLSEIGACSYLLKEPTDNKNSLDIAVTVVRILYEDKSYDPEVLFGKDKSIFRLETKGVCSYVRHVGGDKVRVLTGSTIFSSHKRPTDNDRVQDLENRKILSPRDDGTWEFVKEYEDTNNRLGRIVSGRKTFDGPVLWKNYQGKSLREYYPTVAELQER